MSKIGKKPIQLPAGVTAQIQAGVMTVKGSKGQLTRNVPSMLTVTIDPQHIELTPTTKAVGKNSKEVMMMWGLYRALIQNMVTGTSEGFQKVLEFQGVGFKANVKGSDLELNLGFSHPVVYKAPEGIAFKVEKNVITVSGMDREVVGQVAAEIRAKRKPEPYKGSGIRYAGEVVRRKAGKKAVASGG